MGRDRLHRSSSPIGLELVKTNLGRVIYVKKIMWERGTTGYVAYQYNYRQMEDYFRYRAIRGFW